MQIFNGSDGLFDVLGPLFALARTIDQVRLSSARPKRNAVAAKIEEAQELAQLLPAYGAWESAGGGLQTTVSQLARRLIVRYAEERGLANPTYRSALLLLLDDLASNSYFFADNAQSITASADAANTGDTILAVSDRGPLGARTLVVPETLFAELSGGRLTVQGATAKHPGSADWPGGSATRTALVTSTARESILAGGDFESALDGWSVATGQIGSTIAWTEPEEQQVTITGAPTGGYFVLTWIDPEGRHWETQPLPHNATADVIQSALRTIRLLSGVIVSGTNPFTVTFENTPGNIAQLGAINRLSGGANPAVSITTTREGDPGSYRGRSLKLTGAAPSEQTTLFQDINIMPGRVYALFVRARRSSLASGILRIELRRGINGTTVTDDQAQLQRLDVNISNLPDNGHQGLWTTYRISTRERMPVTFVLQTADPLPADQSIWLDELVLVPATRLYAGGPYCAACQGWRYAEGDRWTITANSDLAGKWVTVFDRWLDLRRETDRTLPTTGTTLVPDSLLD